MKPIELKINIDELCALKTQSDAMEFYKKAAAEYESRANLLANEVNALKAKLDALRDEKENIHGNDK